MNPKIITILIVLAVSGVLSVVFIWPKVGVVQDMRVQVGSRQAEARVIEQRFQATAEAVSQYEKLSAEDIEMVESALPIEADLSNLYILLQSLISSAGLIGEGIQVDERIGSLDISFTLHGTYESFKAFLIEAERSLRIFDVETITFSSERSPGSITFGVKMKTYIKE